MNEPLPMGDLRRGWRAEVADYAIAGGWACDGELLLVADATGVVSAFAGGTGERAWYRPSTHDHGLLTLALAPAGDCFATAGEDGVVNTFDARSGELRSRAQLAQDWIEHLDWAPDGDRIIATAGRHVYALDREGAVLWQSSAHASTVSAIDWTPAGEVLTASYGQVRFIDPQTGAELEDERLSWRGSLLSLAVSPDGDIIACGSQDNTVHFWRRISGQDSMMSGYAQKPGVIAFDREGHLLATNGGESVTVWSFSNGGPEGTAPGVHELHRAAVKALAFAHRGLRLASADKDGGVIVWSLKKDASGGPTGADLVHGTVEALYWRDDDTALAAIDGSGGVTVWYSGQGQR